jgi:hypothetical protein
MCRVIYTANVVKLLGHKIMNIQLLTALVVAAKANW